MCTHIHIHVHYVSTYINILVYTHTVKEKFTAKCTESVMSLITNITT